MQAGGAVASSVMVDDVDHVTEVTLKQRVQEGSRTGNGMGMEMVGHGTTKWQRGQQRQFLHYRPLWL